MTYIPHNQTPSSNLKYLSFFFVVRSATLSDYLCLFTNRIDFERTSVRYVADWSWRKSCADPFRRGRKQTLTLTKNWHAPFSNARETHKHRSLMETVYTPWNFKAGGGRVGVPLVTYFKEQLDQTADFPETVFRNDG